MIIDTHYDILSITQDAPDNLIRAVYLALARKYHPDRNLTNPEAMRMMQLINIAYQNLSVPDSRAAHDDWINQQRPKAPAPVQAAPEKRDPKTEKARADAEAWIALAEKDEKEAAQAQERFSTAAAKAAAALERDKAKWKALAAQAEAEAKATKAKALETRNQANAAAQKAGMSFTPQGGIAEQQTHYALLKITPNAPAEVIRAAYKALAQKYASELQQSQPETASFVQALNQAYKVLSDAQKKAQYDSDLNLNTPQVSPENAPLAMRPLSEKEKELFAAAEQAQNIAKAKLAMAERTQEEAREAEERAQQATTAAIQKSKEKDAEKWRAWAEKVTADATAAKARAQKAVAEAEAAKQAAKETTARAAAEKIQADKLAAADAADAAQTRAIRENAERAEREKQG